MDTPTPILTLTDQQKFDALKMRFEDQVKLLRYMTTLDFRIFGSYITLQLLLGGWLSQHLIGLRSQIGIAIIDLALTVVAGALLHNDYKRRLEVAATLKNISVALRFSEPDAYITPGTLNASMKLRAWRYWYLFGIVVAFFGIMFLLFSGSFVPPVSSPLPLPTPTPTP